MLHSSNLPQECNPKTTNLESTVFLVMKIRWSNLLLMDPIPLDERKPIVSHTQPPSFHLSQATKIYKRGWYTLLRTPRGPHGWNLPANHRANAPQKHRILQWPYNVLQELRELRELRELKNSSVVILVIWVCATSTAAESHGLNWSYKKFI